MGDVSARPDRLNDFAAKQQRLAEQLQHAGEMYFPAFRAFVNAPGGDLASSGVPLMNTTFPNLVSDFGTLGRFVKAVADAVIAADDVCVMGDGVQTVDHVALLNAMAAAHPDIASLSEVKQAATIDLPVVGTFPKSSGYVSDPVCTATGFLVSRSLDFALPPRLALLAGERTYASGSTHAGPYGRGWCSWFDVRLEPGATGLTLITNDARHINLDDQDRCAAVGLHAQQHDSGTTVAWNSETRLGAQKWEFDRYGRLLTVTGELIGLNTFVRNRTGQIVELRHDSGRSVSYRWRKGRVVGATSSDGRSASCGYDADGDIVELSNAIDPQRFDLDDLGRIQRIVDADGVVRAEMEYDEESRVVCQRSATGVATRFSYAAPYRTTVRDADGDALSVYVHNPSGQVQMVATVDGLRLSQRFDNLGELTAQTYPDGRSFVQQATRDDDGRVEERVWSTGLAERFEFDHDGRLVRHTTSLAAGEGSSTVSSYTGDSTLPSHLDLPDGSFFDLEWTNGSPSAIRDADGVTVTANVEADGTVSEVVNGLGHRQTFVSHASGRVSESTFPDGGRVSIDYDDAGRPTRLMAVDGATIEVQYTAAGRVRSMTDPTNATYHVEYEQRGLVAAVIDPLGFRTEFDFDDYERLVHIGLADSTAINLDVDLCGRLVGIAVDDAKWEMTRDVAGRPTTVTDPVGRTTLYEHSESGRETAITDPTGATWRYSFDAALRLMQVQAGDGNQVDIETTPTGKIARMVDEAGVEHISTFTPAGRVASHSDGNTTTRFDYDAAGQLATIEKPGGAWRYERDSRGRMTRAVSPEGRERRLEYDGTGRVVAMTTGGARWTYQYDLAGRVVETVDPAGRRVQLVYDALGNVASVTDPAQATTQYRYDERGRTIEMIDALGESWTYAYDALDNVTTVSAPFAEPLTTTFDASGCALATRFGSGDVTTRELDAAGRDVFIRGASDTVRLSRVPGGATTDTGVDDWWTSLGWAADGGLRQVGDLSTAEWPEVETDRDGMVVAIQSDRRRVELTRDQAGLVIRRTDYLRDSTDGAATITTVVTITRDAAGRITKRVDSVGTHEFEYDAAGRLVRAMTTDNSDKGEGSLTRTWEYDVLGRLVREEGPNGATTYEYGRGHRLLAMATPSGSTRFEYDDRGRRVASFGETQSRFEWGELGLRRAMVNGVEVDSVPSVVGLPTMVGGIDIAWDVPSRVGLAYADGFDLVDVLISAQTGALGSTTWGECSASATPEWHPFHGISAAGLVWLGSRVYDPTTRQFLSPDPASVELGTPSGTWTYSYASADPINMFDPWGTQPVDVDTFNKIMDEATSVQWKAIITVVVVVAICVAVPVAVTALGPVILGTAGAASVAGTVATGAVSGALVGGLSDIATQLINNGGVTNWTSVGKSTLLGGLFGGGGAYLGTVKNVAAFENASRAKSAIVNAGLEGTSSTASELLDVAGIPGGDGKFNVNQILMSTAGGGGFGALKSNAKDVGDAAAVRIGRDDIDLTPGFGPKAEAPSAVPRISVGPDVPLATQPKIKGNINSNGEQIYHLPGSQYYDRVIPETTFDTVEQAAAAGFRPTVPMQRADPSLPSPATASSKS